MKINFFRRPWFNQYPSGIPDLRVLLAYSSRKAFRMCVHPKETFEKYSILVKVKKGENFTHRNILNISRIEI